MKIKNQKEKKEKEEAKVQMTTLKQKAAKNI